MNKRIFLYILFHFILSIGYSKDCKLNIKGIVKDKHTGFPLNATNVFIQEIAKGTSTKTDGTFTLQNICQGTYHIVVSHTGCIAQNIYVALWKDTTLFITLEHSTNPLEDVIIKKEKTISTTQNKVFITEKTIKENIHQDISNLLETTSGVSILKTGTTISKPIVHGLYGNRLAILNNGIPQSGQQWGNDHSPEIDPLSANKLTIIKGANALEYAGVNYGSVILVESGRINKDPHFHGNGNYFFETNGSSNGVNLQLQQYKNSLGWKVNGTFKKSGDKKTPNYFLTNTGSEEKHFSFQLEKDVSNKFFTRLYFSSFNSKLGILRGAHISNLTDLMEALNRTTPFFTEDKFSYKIYAPYQEVRHQLLKISSTFYFKENAYLNFSLAAQSNARKEYDIRRSSTNKKPSLSLTKYSVFGEGKYTAFFKNNLKLNIGVQFNLYDNTNSYKTGVIPLIPDYYSYNSGIYGIIKKNIDNWFFELGARYDNILQNVASISVTTPRKIVRYSNQFHNISSTFGFINKLSQQTNLYFNIGFTTRNPEINELYSNGLHQGVSGIEEGNPVLNVEKSLKTTLALNTYLNNTFSFEALLYYHFFNDYIYLNPQNQFRLTIRGAYPVFVYEQTDATIYGMDFSSQFNFSKSFKTKFLVSLIKGNDTKNDKPLINIPSGNVNWQIKFLLPNKKQINKITERMEFSIENRYVFKQNNLLAEQDYLVPPNGYYLLGANIAFHVPISKSSFHFFLKATNLLNTSYRDYLNRQKYFADEIGRNIIFGVNWQF